MENKSMTVSLRQIMVEPKFNCRVDYSGVREPYKDRETGELRKSLADEMMESRYIVPVLVRPVDGEKNRYRLIAGFRRFYAAEHNYQRAEDADEKRFWLENFPVIVKDCDDKEAYFLNMQENTARKNLTSYEIAARSKFLSKRFNMKQTDVAERLGFTQGHISPLIKAFDKLAPEIVEAWKGNDPRVTHRVRSELASIDDHTEQLKKWHAKTGNNDSGNGVRHGGGPDRQPATRARKLIEQAHERMVGIATGKVKVKDMIASQGRLLSHMLEWALGLRDEYPGMAPPAEKEAKRGKGTELKHSKVQTREKDE